MSDDEKSAAQRTEELASAASLVPLAIQPSLESLPLPQLLTLCRTYKRVNDECKKIMTDIVRRVLTEEPRLPLSLLRDFSSAPDVDKRLRNACIQRLEEKKTLVCGIGYSLALLDNGDVVGWNYYMHDVSQISGATQALPEGRIYVSLSAGTERSFGLLDDGRIVSWGVNPTWPVPALQQHRRYISVSAGFWHVLALLDNGHVVGWGHDTHGESSGGMDVLPPGRRYVAVSAGMSFSLGLLDSGQVVSWGNAMNVATDRPCIAISANFVTNDAVGLMDNGEPVGWGGEDFIDESVDVANYVRRRNLRLVSISAGNPILGLLNNGQVISWAQRTASGGHLRRGPLLEDGRYVSIAAGFQYSAALTASGRIRFWNSALVESWDGTPPPGRKFV